jgi:putative oxidoreductase
MGNMPLRLHAPSEACGPSFVALLGQFHIFISKISAMKYFFSSQGLGQQTGLGLIRILVGAFMIYHGWEVFNKDTMSGYEKWLTDLHFPAPGLMAYLGKGSEFVGGVFLALGLFTRLAIIPIIIAMGVICFGMGKGRIFTDEQHPFLFILLCLVFFFCGPGRYSLDKIIFKGKEPRLVVT